MKMYPCDKCNNTGKVIWKHVHNGICFKCMGSKFLNYDPHLNIPDKNENSNMIDNGETYMNNCMEESFTGYNEWYADQHSYTN